MTAFSQFRGKRVKGEIQLTDKIFFKYSYHKFVLTSWSFSATKLAKALQMEMNKQLVVPVLAAWVSAPQGQVCGSCDLILCFIRCKFNELLFLSNINLRKEHCNFVLSEFVCQGEMRSYSLELSGDSQVSCPLSSLGGGGGCWPLVRLEAMVCGCGLPERV